jgi:hypothetical protein
MCPRLVDDEVLIGAGCTRFGSSFQSLTARGRTFGQPRSLWGCTDREEIYTISEGKRYHECTLPNWAIRQGYG